MLPFGKRLLFTIGIPAGLAGMFLLSDMIVHGLMHMPWPDLTHLVMAGLILILASVILTVQQQAIARREQGRTVMAAREAGYRMLFDQFPEPTTVWSDQGVLLMQNLVSARNMGGRRENYLGKSVLDMFGPEAGPPYLERLQRVFRTGVIEEQEDAVSLPLGQRYFWTAMQRVSLADGRDAVQVISYDITERVQAEHAWREEHQRASTYLNVAPVLFVAMDVNGTVQLINATGCQVLGCTESEVVGTNWFNTFVPERVREQVQSDYVRLLATTQENSIVYESPILSTTGDERLIAWHPVVFRDESGQATGTLASGEDITERRRAEEALRESETLRIQERSALAERQKLARELHDSVSQALYGIALGVNTALTMLDRDREAVREALNYSIGLARAGLSEMRALIFELRPESLASEGLVAALVKTAEATSARFELPVQVDACGEPNLPLRVKEVIYRVAQEALHNAIKHAHARELTLQLSCDTNWLKLVICDDGVGFDPGAAYPGHLGLRSMRERAASAGGGLCVTSAPGAGTTVELQVPLTDG